MATIRKRCVVDEKGKRVGVLLDLADYRQLLQEAEEEEMKTIRAYDAAKAAGDAAIPFEQAVVEIERSRR